MQGAQKYSRYVPNIHKREFLIIKLSFNDRGEMFKFALQWID